MDKIIDLLRKDGKVKDQEAVYLIFRKSDMPNQESNREMAKGDAYEFTTEKWIFGLLNLHMGRSGEVVSANAIAQINNLDVVSPLELGKGVRNANGLRRWLLG